MSLEIRLPQADLLGFSDFTVTIIDTSDISNDEMAVSSDSIVVLTGATAVASGQTYFRISLPASPDEGDIIRFKSLNTGTNDVQIQSATIESTAQTLEIDHSVDFFLIYVSSTIGWVVMG